MRTVVALGVAIFAGLTTSAAPAPLGSATGVATPHSAGAMPAGLTVSLTLELKCGKPPRTRIVVSLPHAWRVPRAVVRRAVWIDSSHPTAVTVSGHALTLQPRVQTGTCTVIGPGTITIRFTRAARLGNPSRAGRYTVHASIGTQTFRARVTIKPAA